ncbi:hypothetical protein FIBSPDRAFT_852844 [Athelia psychrophila]|uniref:Uncharacterized protein n=1 Tax=Athelia psychrophila TaxID=1759441 RepID=A0A166RJI6_9AGAM|nr:hypothetical protein FIBSPDRAFT_852844 [Fibularhizoctonia sp. CBS 109695]
MFRWSYYAALHPSDIRILETIGEECIRYEEESGTVFMSRDAIARLSKWLNRGVPRPRPSQTQRKRW